MSDDKPSLPMAPKDLCFSELNFIQDNFDVDAFLQDHRKIMKLEKMRDDLGIYLKLLRSAMIDLINRDYTDFVNLSSNLIGLDESINCLEIPLGQLREEVMQVQQSLDDEIMAITNSLNENCQIRERKQSLYSTQHVYKSLKKLSLILSADFFMESYAKIDVLEQAAVEFNQLKFHISRCKMDISKDQEIAYEKLEDTLITYMNELFLACTNEKNSALLIRCLRIYDTLNKITAAEFVIRKNVIEPIVNNIIIDENLQSDLHGLQTIYIKFLSILNEELKQLLDVTLHSNKTSVEGFNFLVNSFWVEIEDKIEHHMKYIFAPGDPELFHKRYTETMRFLEKLDEIYKSPVSTNMLKNHPQYKNFLRKWNLPVYFQIRFQEIAGQVESILKDTISPNSMKGSIDSLVLENFSLHATDIVWTCLLKMWNDDTYLSPLFQHFWKLSLQVCSRYQNWSKASLKQVWPTLHKANNTNEVGVSTKLDFLVHLYSDIIKLVEILPSFLKVVENKFSYQNPTLQKLLFDCLDETSKSIVNILPMVTQEIVNELLMQCVVHLKQVSDIPRLFRRTNRDVPSKPCAYVKNLLSSLITFYTNYNKYIPAYVTYWLQLTLSSLSEQYLTSVRDVLTSVQKTEESLRRLKKIRDKSIGAFPPDTQGISDDEKIRIQLQVDVHAYINTIKDLNISISNVLYLEELAQAVEEALKKNSSI